MKRSYKRIQLTVDTSGSLSDVDLDATFKDIEEAPPSLQITCTGGSKVSNIRVGKGTHVILVTDGYRAPWYVRLFSWMKRVIFGRP